MIRQIIYKRIHGEIKFIYIYIDIINLGTRVLGDSGRKLDSTKEVKKEAKRESKRYFL